MTGHGHACGRVTPPLNMGRTSCTCISHVWEYGIQRHRACVTAQLVESKECADCLLSHRSGVIYPYKYEMLCDHVSL